MTISFELGTAVARRLKQALDFCDLHSWDRFVPETWVLIFTGRNDEMRAEVKVENLEFSDFSTTYHLFRLENLRGIYYVH